MAVSHRTARPHVEEYRFADGRRAYLLGEGRLINLAAGQGHPVEIMDLSFALQALSAEHIAKHGKEMEVRVHPVPAALDREVARAALSPLGIRLDEPDEGTGEVCRGMGGRDDMSEEKVPDELRYTKSHEWVKVDGESATSGSPTTPRRN